MTALATGIQAVTDLWQQGQGVHQFSMAAGHLCFLLLSITMTAGLLAHTRWLGAAATRWADEVHQWAGPWTVYTGLVHALMLHYDQGKGMPWAGILLPSLSGHHGWPIALGIYGFYAFLVVAVSGYLLGVIRGYLWRWLHWLSFPAWLLALTHVLLLTHGMALWEQILYVGSGVVILGLTGARFLFRKPRSKPVIASVL